ncbi:MAG: UpxY family transcription antiterminator [Acidobacteriaceae bacterium]
MEQQSLETSPHSWYAVSTRSRHEKVAAITLEAMGIEQFLPVISEARRWSDRTKTVHFPLFPGYLFVRIAKRPEFLVRVLKAPGVVSFVGNGNGPVTVADREIESVRMVTDHSSVCSRHPFFTAGDRVRVVRGALAGAEGTFLRQRAQSRLIVSIEMIQRSVSVEVAESDVEVLPSLSAQACESVVQ